MPLRPHLPKFDVQTSRSTSLLPPNPEMADFPQDRVATGAAHRCPTAWLSIKPIQTNCSLKIAAKCEFGDPMRRLATVILCVCDCTVCAATRVEWKSEGCSSCTSLRLAVCPRRAFPQRSSEVTRTKDLTKTVGVWPSRAEHHAASWFLHTLHPKYRCCS